MIHTKRVIFMILPLLFVPVVYGISSTRDACAVPPERIESCEPGETSDGRDLWTCCWTETEEGDPEQIEIYKCQYCAIVQGKVDCTTTWAPPTTGENIVPGDTGVLEQPEQPPLFGRNEGAVPPTGGVEQPFTSTPFQQIPQGQVQPFIQSETPPTPSPTPAPPPPLPPPTQTGPTVAPQDSQDDEGGGLPATQNQENVPLDDGAAEQPEDEGQEDSSEGAETAGPLT